VVTAALATALAKGALASWLAPPPHPAPPPAPAPLAEVEPAPAPVSAPPPAEPLEPAALPRAPVALPEPPPAEPLVTLDDLLRLPPAAPSPERLDLADDDAPAPGAERDRTGRIRVDYSRETLLRDVPTQPERRRTDLGVSVRVGEEDRLRLRGGVRVESKEGEEEREASPSVGVEVRF
jgi:hypothetical protein